MVVLDSWALLAYLRNEPVAHQVEAEWLARGAAISSIDLGEALYLRIRERGDDPAVEEVAAIREHCAVIDLDWPLIVAAARIKATGGLAYADAFCIATAERLGAPLLTGDPEILRRAGEIGCDVVDLRPIGAS